MYVYVNSEKPGLYGSDSLWTVGFYKPITGEDDTIFDLWVSESDWANREEAAQRVHYLNGGGGHPHLEAYKLPPTMKKPEDRSRYWEEE